MGERTGSVAVVGAGVGGLMAAAALQRRGLEVSVFERAPRLRRQGSGLTLYTNAVAALREIGLVDLLGGIAEPIERMVVISAQGGRLAEVRLDRTARRFSAPSVNVHRGNLLETLASTVGEDNITFDARCVGFEQDDTGVAARFADGTEHRADLLVVLAGSVGAGFYPLTGGRVGWFLDDPDPRRSPADDPIPETLLRHAEGWSPVTREAIAATPPASIIHNEIRDLPPYKRWGEGRVTLLGDAAHPMLPTLGQGACQAIEDAAALVRSLDSTGDVENALRVYERGRTRRAAAFVRASRRSWDLRSHAPAVLRDALMRAVPQRMLSYLFDRSIRPAKATR